MPQTRQMLSDIEALLGRSEVGMAGAHERAPAESLLVDLDLERLLLLHD